ncbi:hypothetical protein LOK49_LG02G00663 [Camellia lanceoleosa]|uniref:Uncharacterized protein n=1 Tax=Camellia lanceoleosa TaxID=1840588 RepID=A0ACC0IJG4_9ERIC|nr:hypothetical protein LOK49_LG02G00663 [Camellia lanceoleosa]
MGVDLATERAGFAKMEDVNFTNLELVYHVRDALRSVTLAALSGKYVDSCLDMLVSNFMPPHSFLELLKVVLQERAKFFIGCIQR